ncbi:MAG: hypothetical protein D6806_16435, partial [Deltaproteobacteria bacterium]
MAKCEHCGHDQDAGKFCDNCGRMLTRVRIAQPGGGDGRPSAGAAGRQGVRCIYCGNVQAAGRICEKCGMQLDRVHAREDEEEEQKRGLCPECGIRTNRPVCPN